MEPKKIKEAPDQSKSTVIRELSASIRTELDSSRLSLVRRTYLLEKMSLLESIDEKP